MTNFNNISTNNIWLPQWWEKNWKKVFKKYLRWARVGRKGRPGVRGGVAGVYMHQKKKPSIDFIFFLLHPKLLSQV